jgi:cysteinyl-tRNA synthetase
VHFYNTLKRNKEEFVPLDPGRVTMYVCGPTVYSYAHIGNARPAVVFDVLARVLRTQYPELCYVRNITDIDDKINKSAAEQGVPISDIADRYTRAYHADLAELGVLPPDVEPRATDHVGAIIVMISGLIDKGYAYEAEGHVLFSVAAYSEYGLLSHRDREDMLAGARIEVAPYKRDPGDFVLWKPSSEDLPGWDSPWGRGRPGWHIECSVMSEQHLGETIDIHGGGHDLIFPHHENELAQSTCAHDGALFVRYWLHNGFVNVDSEKMSKSLGNVLLVRDLLQEAPGEAIRLALLNAHYRAPLDWSDDTLPQAKRRLDGLYQTLRALADVPDGADAELPQGFMNALQDDLNTPRALAELAALAKRANSTDDQSQRMELKSSLKRCGMLLGLLQQDPARWFGEGAEDLDATLIEQLISERNAARTERDYTKADEVRDRLGSMGVTIEDGQEGTRWRRA